MILQAYDGAKTVARATPVQAVRRTCLYGQLELYPCGGFRLKLYPTKEALLCHSEREVRKKMREAGAKKIKRHNGGR